MFNTNNINKIVIKFCSKNITRADPREILTYFFSYTKTLSSIK